MIKRSRIEYAKQFQKQLKKAPIEIKTAFLKRRVLFSENPSDSSLNNHALTGKLLGKRSINITGDWRAIYSESLTEEGETVVMFYLLGTHSQLYK